MTVRVYKSSDASAPVLSGTTGAMVALLDAVLVNGYGTQPAMGWSKPFSATNFGVYRAPTGTRYYLMVDDTSTFTTATTCKLRGYEIMTDATDTGTNPFPSVAQSTNGQTINKSSTVSSTARAWMIIASERSFYFFCASASSVASIELAGSTSVAPFDVFFFGEIKSFKATTDTYNSFLFTNLITTIYQGSGSESSWGTTMNSHFMARNYNGAKVAHPCAWQMTGAVNGNNYITPDSSGFYGFPEPGTGELGPVALEVIEQSENSTNPVQWLVRGRMPGGYMGMVGGVGSVDGGAGAQRQAFIFNGSGPTAGRQFIQMHFGWQSGYTTPAFLIELTDNWYA